MRSVNSVLSLAVAATLISAIHPAGAAEPSTAEAPRALGKINVTVDEQQSRSAVGNSTVVASDRLEAEQAQSFEDAIRYVPGAAATR
jgi:outer membrane receptor for ferrienterochelin and colicin